MPDDGKVPTGRPWTTWVTAWHWRERIIHFTPSWFTVTMGTGILIQLLTNFPYPAQWIIHVGYAFWILSICLFSLCSTLLIIRFVWFPILIKKTIDDFSQSNFFGAIPVGFHTIIVGLIFFYNSSMAAVWAAYGLFWVSVAMTIVVSLGEVSVTFTRQPPHKLESVTGVWLLCFVPMVVTSATGAALLPYLPYPHNTTVLVVSFLMWSLGQGCCFMVLTVYFWRLMAFDVPKRDAIVSCFIPLGPLGQGSYSILAQAIFLSNYLKTSEFVPAQSAPSHQTTQAIIATAEAIHWMGIFGALFLIGHATFWLVEASSCLIFRIPKKFNIGFWSFTFPLGAYAYAVGFVAQDLNNDGLKGWAATCTVAVVIFWLICAGGTLYKGFWKGEMFYAPGLEGWLVPDPKSADRSRPMRPVSKRRHQSQRYLDDYASSTRVARHDGTYIVTRLRPVDEENLGHGDIDQL